MFIIAASLALAGPLHAQLNNLDKDHRALIERGLRIHGQELGSALVLKDVLYIPGQHMDDAGNIVDNPVPIGVRGYPSGYNAAVKDPWFRGVHTIANLGSKNSGLSGDVLLAWFQVADESLDGPSYRDEWYFMVINALVDPTGSAAATRQNIQLNFINGVAKQVQRLNPDSGQLDVIDLEIIPKTGGRRRLIANLDGGAADLFKFNTGAPFVRAHLSQDTTHNIKANAKSAQSGNGPNPSLSWAIVLFLTALGLWITLLPGRRTYEVKK
jgi:hypothetical protein